MRNAVRVKTGVVGEDTYIDQIGKTAAVARTSRHATTPIVSTEWQRRRISMKDYDWGDYIDVPDKIKMLADPTAEYVLNASYALGRAIDDEIITQTFGTAYIGKTGSATETFPTSTNVVAVGSAGLTVNKLLDAKEILDNNDVDDMEPRYVAITGTQLNDLLKEDKVTSADYDTIRALVAGKVDTFCGFKFIIVSTSLLDTDSDSYRRVIAWAQNGLGVGISRDIVTDVSPDITHNMDILVQAHLGVGAARLDSDKVVEIKCSEA